MMANVENIASNIEMMMEEEIKEERNDVNNNEGKNVVDELKTEFERGTPSLIRGVNLGGWLVLDRFVTPHLFAVNSCQYSGDFCWYKEQIGTPPKSNSHYKECDMKKTCSPVKDPYPVDEKTLMDLFSNEGKEETGTRYLDYHFEYFVTREDIMNLKKLGNITHLRVPIPHYIISGINRNTNDDRWLYFIRLVNWCREFDIQVWPVITTIPESALLTDAKEKEIDESTAENLNFSLHDNVAQENYCQDLLPTWEGEQITNSLKKLLASEEVKEEEMGEANQHPLVALLESIELITKTIVNDGLCDVVSGVGILNRPLNNCDDLDPMQQKQIDDYINEATTIIKNNLGDKTHVYYTGTLNNNNKEEESDTSKSNDKLFVDNFEYQFATKELRHLSPRQHIAYACNYDQRNNNHIKPKGTSNIVGEWNVGYDVNPISKLSDIMESIRKNALPVDVDRELTFQRKIFLKQLAISQMVAYEGGERQDLIPTAAAAATSTTTVATTTKEKNNADAELAKFSLTSLTPQGDSLSLLNNNININKEYSNMNEHHDSGWFFYNFKMEGNSFAEFDYLRGLKEGWIPKLPSSSESVASQYDDINCKNIIFQVKDDTMDIVDNSSDELITSFGASSKKTNKKKNTDKEEEESSALDDDIVVSHGQSLIDKAGNFVDGIGDNIELDFNTLVNNTENVTEAFFDGIESGAEETAHGLSSPEGFFLMIAIFALVWYFFFRGDRKFDVSSFVDYNYSKFNASTGGGGNDQYSSHFSMDMNNQNRPYNNNNNIATSGYSDANINNATSVGIGSSGYQDAPSAQNYH